VLFSLQYSGFTCSLKRSVFYLIGHDYAFNSLKNSGFESEIPGYGVISLWGCGNDRQPVPPPFVNTQ
jgi:hypothetical protein